MNKTHITVAIIPLALVVITLLVVLGSIALVLAILSPILCSLWILHKRSGGGVEPSGGRSKASAPRNGSFKALLREMRVTSEPDGTGKEP